MLNLGLTLQVCFAIFLQKNINRIPPQGADLFCCCCCCSNVWMICERVLHAVMQMAAILGRAEELEGEEETSIFGDGILMVSQGRGLLWAPLLRWQRWRNLQETSSRGRQSQTNKNKMDSYFGVLQLQYIQYKLTNPSGRAVTTGSLQSSFCPENCASAWFTGLL